jgi:DNA-directed RNA polymerase subunit RPC12/RpoP
MPETEETCIWLEKWWAADNFHDEYYYTTCSTNVEYNDAKEYKYCPFCGKLIMKIKE